MEAVRSVRVIAGFAIAALIINAKAWSEDARDHQAPGDVSTQSATLQNTPPTRQEALVQGFREAGLSASALQALDRELSTNPRVDSSRFNGIVDRLSQNGSLLSNGQASDLKRMFQQNLDGVEGDAGRELSQAAKKVLAESQSTGGAGAGQVPAGALNPQGLAGLTPEAISAFMKGLGAQFGNGVPQQDADGGGLLERGALAALDKLLNRDKEGEGEGRGRGGDDRGPKGPPDFGKGRGERVRDEGKDKKEDSHKLLDALKNRDNGRGAAPQQPAQSGGGEKSDGNKEKEQAKGSSGGESSSKKRSNEDDEPKKEEAKADPSKSFDPASVLDSLNKGGPSGPPKKGNPLPPMQAGGGAYGGGMFGGSAAPSVGGGGGGGFSGPPMLGGGGGGMVGGGGGFGVADPFGSVGAGSLGMDNMPGSPGFAIAKDGGYGGSGGGSYDEGGAGSDLAGDDDLDGFTASGNRIPSRAEQIDMTPRWDGEADFLLKRQIGYTGRNLCTSDYAKKTIGICEGIASRKQRAMWWKRMETEAGIR